MLFFQTGEKELVLATTGKYQKFPTYYRPPCTGDSNCDMHTVIPRIVVEVPLTNKYPQKK